MIILKILFIIFILFSINYITQGKIIESICDIINKIRIKLQSIMYIPKISKLLNINRSFDIDTYSDMFSDDIYNIYDTINNIPLVKNITLNNYDIEILDKHEKIIILNRITKTLNREGTYNYKNIKYTDNNIYGYKNDTYKYIDQLYISSNIYKHNKLIGYIKFEFIGMLKNFNNKQIFVLSQINIIDIKLNNDVFIYYTL